MPGEFTYPPQSSTSLGKEWEPGWSSHITNTTQIPLPNQRGSDEPQTQPANALVISRPMIHPKQIRQTRSPRLQCSHSPDAPAEQSLVIFQKQPEVETVSRTQYIECHRPDCLCQIIREKTRILTQADLVTKQIIEEKDKAITALSTEVRGLNHLHDWLTYLVLCRFSSITHRWHSSCSKWSKWNSW